MSHYVYPDTVSRDSDWRDSAACCDEEDPEVFFPKGSDGPWVLVIEEAKAVCRRCPVMEECLQWALETGQDFGVWGGLSEWDRRRLQRRASRPPREPAAEPSYTVRKAGTFAETIRGVYDDCTSPQEDGHVMWTGPHPSVSINGKNHTFNQIAFEVGHGRKPDGPVKRTCDVYRCVAAGHLMDSTMRAAAKASV